MTPTKKKTLKKTVGASSAKKTSKAQKEPRKAPEQSPVSTPLVPPASVVTPTIRPAVIPAVPSSSRKPGAGYRPALTNVPPPPPKSTFQEIKFPTRSLRVVGILLLIVLAVGASFGIGLLVTRHFFGSGVPDRVLPNSPIKVTDFDDCVAKGFPIQESRPRKCHTPDGQFFTQVVPVNSDLETKDPMLVVTSPVPGELVHPSFLIEGKARIYEKPLIIQVLDPDLKPIFEGNASVQAPTNGGNYGDFSLRVELRGTVPQSAKVVVTGVSDAEKKPVGPLTIPIKL